jgi:pilus assembly protein Flp/PilA
MKFAGRLQEDVARFLVGAASFGRDEAGQDLIEYALVASLVALAAVASMKNVGVRLAATFTTLSTAVTGAV